MMDDVHGRDVALLWLGIGRAWHEVGPLGRRRAMGGLAGSELDCREARLEVAHLAFGGCRPQRIVGDGLSKGG